MTFSKSLDFLLKVLTFYKKSGLFTKKSGSQLLASLSDGILALWNAMRSCLPNINHFQSDFDDDNDKSWSTLLIYYVTSFINWMK